MYKLDYSNQFQLYLDFIKKFEKENSCEVYISFMSRYYEDWTMPSSDDTTDDQYEKLVAEFEKQRVRFFDDNKIDPNVLTTFVLKDDTGKYEQYVSSDS